MKNRIKIMLTTAIVAVAMSLTGCTPETVDELTPASQYSTTPEVDVSVPETLTGTQWVCQEDYMLHVAGTGDVHVVKDVTLTFLTDSTGTRNTKVVGGDLPADADFTCGITYSYNAETGVCEWVDEMSGQEPSLQYDPQRKALVNEYWAFHKVE